MAHGALCVCVFAFVWVRVRLCVVGASLAPLRFIQIWLELRELPQIMFVCVALVGFPACVAQVE